MYSLAGYGKMLADRVRMEAYCAALRRSVRPGDVVVDLGAGQCVMSCLAVQLGAARVHAIDPSAVIEAGRAIARANGLEDRIEFHREFSNAVTLPERADVIVSDLRGVLPAWEGHFAAIADARERLLKPGGTLIPRRDTLWLALAEAPAKYSELLDGWSFDGLDLSIGRRMVANGWVKAPLAADQLLSAPVQWAEVDYRAVADSAVCGQADAEVSRGGTAHGLCVWFDAELLEGVGFSNAPGQPEAIYGQALFPLLDPVEVSPGDRFETAIRADFTGDDYTWSWHTTIRSADGAAKADFRQSTFLGAPLSTEILRKRADVFVPSTSENVRVDREILGLFGSGKNLREIAEIAAARFPGRFADWQSAFDRVAALSGRYSP